MGELDYAIEPEVECPDNDPNDVAFVRVTATIGGCDAVEEYVACKIYPLAASFDFEDLTIAVEHAYHFLVEVETEAKRVLGSFGPREYDALGVMNILNDGLLNHILE
jgi:hypothetical protein